MNGIYDQLLAWQPDIIGLSEFRGTPASQQLAGLLAEAGYPHQLSSTLPDKLATNALLLASRYPLQAIKARYMPKLPERWILAKVDLAQAGLSLTDQPQSDQPQSNQPQSNPPLAELSKQNQAKKNQAKPWLDESLTVGLLHIPNYTKPHLKYPFIDAVLKMTKFWKLGPAIIGGDTNCGKRNIDEEKPMTGNFNREHDFIVDMENHGWPDVFRHLHGDRREYTWYSHRNNGFRLDFAFLSPDLASTLTATRHEWGHSPAEPERREGLSDHAALIVDIKGPTAP